ncbi:MAG: hypothetical protein IKS37_10285 [Solobacterium sp.]|nr:hypothetical protein [Solobacterium sp.]
MLKKIITIVLCCLITGLSIRPTELQAKMYNESSESTRSVVRNVSTSRSHYVSFTRPDTNASWVGTVTVYINGTITVNGSGNITSASFSGSTSQSTYLYVTTTRTISGSAVTVNYTIHTRNGASYLSGNVSGSVTFYA